MTEDQNRTYQDKFMLRLPDGMREQIRHSADSLGRSMNAEIVQRLKHSLEDDADSRFAKIYLPHDLWSTLFADAHLRGMDDHDRLVQILENAFSNTPDTEQNTDKVYEVYAENVRVTDENSDLKEQIDIFVSLYYGKIIQLSQLAQLIMSHPENVPEKLRRIAEDIESLSDFERKQFDFRRALAEGRQALFRNKIKNAAKAKGDGSSNPGDWDWENSPADLPPILSKSEAYPDTGKAKKAKKA